MSAITLTAASWISYLAQTTAANRAAVVAGWFPSGATIEFLDADDAVIRTVTTASWSVAAAQGTKYPVVPGTYTDSATGSGTPVTAVFKDGSTERFRCTCGTSASDFYRLSANIVAGVPIRRGSFSILIDEPPAPGNTEPVNTVAPVVSGTASIGSVLTCTAGTWTGNPVPSVTRQWYRGSTAISGAIGLAYTLVSADLGALVTCVESATNLVATNTATSNAIGPVIDGSLNVTNIPSPIRIPQGGSFNFDDYITGGTPPYTVSLDSGSLPSGVTKTGNILSATGSATITTTSALSWSVIDSEVSTTLPTFGVLSTVGGTDLPFTYGHVFKEGDVPSGQYVNSDLTDWQCVPTTYWPDGSVRHAIISGRATCTSNVLKSIALSVSSSDRSGTTLTETNLASALPTVTLQAGGDSFTLNSLVGTSAKHRTVCTGPVMSNWLYRRAISGSNHLVAWFDVRLYVGGNVEIFPWVENAYLTVASPVNDVRTWTLTIGGVQKFSQSIDVKHHSRPVLISGTYAPYWTGTDPQIVPKHDVAYLRATKMVTNNVYPPSEATLANTSEFPQTYTPNWLGTTKAAMASTGYGNHIGPFPNWQAGYIATGDARAYRATIVNGMAAGSWPTHFRAEAGSAQAIANATHANEPIKYSVYPNVSIDWSGSPTIPPGTGNNNTDGTGTQAAPDRAHQPSLGYLPWLLTGRWFFLEEQLFWVTWSYLKESNYSTREGAKGLWFDGQIRARGWHARSHAQLLASLPADHPCFADIKYTWEQNCAAYEARYITGTRDSGAWVNNLGCMGLYSGDSGEISPYGSAGNYWWDAPWMQDTLILAFGLAREMDVPQSSASKASHIAVSNFGYKHAVGLAGGSGASEHSYRYFGEFETPYATDSTALPPESWLPDWGASLAVRKTYGGGQSPGALPNLSYAEPSSVYYGSSPVNAVDWAWHSAIAFHLGSLVLAAEHGATDAAAAWARITGATNFSTSGFDQYSIWGFAPRASVAPSYGLVFPSNGQAGANIALDWTGANMVPAHSHTAIWKIKHTQQTGYYAVSWHCRADNTFAGGWDYIGAHPYPCDGTHNSAGQALNYGSAFTTHYFELVPTGGTDFIASDGGSPLLVTKGQWYSQARTVEVINGGTQVRFRFWPDIDGNPGYVIEKVFSVAGDGVALSGAPLKFRIGCSPWTASGSTNSECPSGTLRHLLQYSVAKSLAQIQPKLSLTIDDTSDPDVWYSNLNPTPTDISDKSGKGHHPSWANANRPSLYTE